MEHLHLDTSIQGTPPFTEHKIWSRKLHVSSKIFISVTSMEGTQPLSRKKGHFFWVPNPGLHVPSFQGHISTQNVTDFNRRLKSLSVH